MAFAGGASVSVDAAEVKHGTALNKAKDGTALNKGDGWHSHCEHKLQTWLSAQHSGRTSGAFVYG